MLREEWRLVELSGTQLIRVELRQVELIFPVPLLLFWSRLFLNLLSRPGGHGGHIEHYAPLLHMQAGPQRQDSGFNNAASRSIQIQNTC
jgi:hypothetical protein